MAEKEAVEASRPPSLVAKVWDAINRDGHLRAFARQGADEIASALKAFPESISVDEPGALWNPTQGEIAADRKRPSPSEVAKDKHPYSPEDSQGNDHDHGRGR